MLIVPDRMPKAHPFYSASSLKIKNKTVSDNAQVEEGSEGDTSGDSDLADRQQDRPLQFVVKNGPCEGHGDFYAPFKQQQGRIFN